MVMAIGGKSATPLSSSGWGGGGTANGLPRARGWHNSHFNPYLPGRDMFQLSLQPYSHPRCIHPPCPLKRCRQKQRQENEETSAGSLGAPHPSHRRGARQPWRGKAAPPEKVSPRGFAGVGDRGCRDTASTGAGGGFVSPRQQVREGGGEKKREGRRDTGKKRGRAGVCMIVWRFFVVGDHARIALVFFSLVVCSSSRAGCDVAEPAA